jgi:FkbH-like protein
MNWRHEEQKWMVTPPKDFREQCKTLKTASDIQSLASTRLNVNQLVNLSSVIKKLQDAGADLSPLTPFRLGVLGNATTCLYVNALAAAAARYGVNLNIEQVEYDQVIQTALNLESPLYLAKPNAILLALDYHGLPFDTTLPGALDYLQTIRDGLSQGCDAPVIYQTIACPPTPLFGSLDVSIHDTLRSKIIDFNRALIKRAQDRGDYVFDVAALVEMIGTQNWHDPAQWNLYKLPFAQNLMPVYVDHIGRMVSSIRGLSKKCLVLDLDNTLWGGVIGDDGLDGIKVGQGDGIAEAHLDIQKTALSLRTRGIILAVCSKNDDAVARKPFQKHPDMLLREEHIAVFQANWKDKATNLEAIAKALNIGLNALVLLDDNPAERAQVRESLPTVSVPELPDDPSYFSRILLNAGYFESVSFSEDDRKRAEQYRANAERAELQSSSRNMTDFLESLNMILKIGSFNNFNLTRVTQLINKTNQFNLTTHRYTETEVKAMMGDPSIITLQARLTDRFGDNGLITVGIGRLDDDVCDIDTWLMSCRVIGRRVEEAILNFFVSQARFKGAYKLRGRYIPSEKNSMVVDHYKKLGFTVESTDDGTTIWHLSLDEYKSPALPFTYENTLAI